MFTSVNKNLNFAQLIVLCKNPSMIKGRLPPLRTALYLLFLLVPVIVYAQSTGQTVVHIHETPDPQSVTTASGAVGLSLKTTFSLLDQDNQVLMAFEIENASIELEDDSYTAVVQELDDPWTVVLLIDASTTMGGYTTSSAFKASKNAITSAMSALPDSTNIAILTFADSVTTRLEFTQSKEAIAPAIRGVMATSFGNSCLNNALFEAVNMLGGAPGRRAVIAFTASADNCATRSVQEVADLAQKNRVQIYPVGLQGYTATEEALDRIANSTGGLAELRDESTLGFGLSNLMAVLHNQWTARATIYPSAGLQSAILKINLKDETILTSPEIQFTSSQDYIPPAEIHLAGNVQSVEEGILFNLDIVQQEKIRQLNVSIISKDTGQSVMAQSLVSFSNINTVPAVNLSPGLEYTLTISAIDSQGNLLSEDSAEFKYNPPQAMLAVTEVTPPTADQENFEVILVSQNVTGAVKFNAWLTNAEAGQPLDGTEITVPLGEPILIPADGVRSGEYYAVVQSLDSADTILAKSPPYKFSYKRANIIVRFSQWVSGSPFAVISLTGLSCLTLLAILALVWFFIPKRASRKDTVELVMPQNVRRPTPGVGPPPSKPAAKPARKPTTDRPKPSSDKSKSRPRAKAHAPVKADIPSAQEAVQKPSADIQILQPEAVNFSAKMEHTPFSIGRREGTDATLPLDSSSGVSGNHLIITFLDGNYYVKDEKSTYGTSNNNKSLEKGKLYPLQDGDVLGLGPEVKIVFRISFPE